jgi:hypothetical protein
MKLKLIIALLTISIGSPSDAQEQLTELRQRAQQGTTIPATWNSYFNEKNFVRLPMDRLPPLGQCVLWYPSRSASDQPLPGNCSELRAAVPGAVLVSHERDPSVVDVTVYDARVPGNVIARGTFGVRTASILRVTYPTSLSIGPTRPDAAR